MQSTSTNPFPKGESTLRNDAPVFVPGGAVSLAVDSVMDKPGPPGLEVQRDYDDMEDEHHGAFEDQADEKDWGNPTGRDGPGRAGPHAGKAAPPWAKPGNFVTNDKVKEARRAAELAIAPTRGGKMAFSDEGDDDVGLPIDRNRGPQPHLPVDASPEEVGWAPKPPLKKDDKEVLDEVLRIYNLPKKVTALHLYVLFAGFHLRSGGIYKYKWYSVKTGLWVDCAYIVFRNPEEAQLALDSFLSKDPERAKKHFYEAECPGLPGHYVQIRRSSREDFEAQPDKIELWPRGSKTEKPLPAYVDPVRCAKLRRQMENEARTKAIEASMWPGQRPRGPPSQFVQPPPRDPGPRGFRVDPRNMPVGPPIMNQVGPPIMSRPPAPPNHFQCPVAPLLNRPPVISNTNFYDCGVQVGPPIMNQVGLPIMNRPPGPHNQIQPPVALPLNRAPVISNTNFYDCGVQVGPPIMNQVGLPIMNRPPVPPNQIRPPVPAPLNRPPVSNRALCVVQAGPPIMNQVGPPIMNRPPAPPNQIRPPVPPPLNRPPVIGNRAPPPPAAAAPPAVKSARGCVLMENVPRGATVADIVTFFEGYNVLKNGIYVVNPSDALTPTWTLVAHFKSTDAAQDAAELDDAPFPYGDTKCKLKVLEYEAFSQMQTLPLSQVLEGKTLPPKGPPPAPPQNRPADPTGWQEDAADLGGPPGWPAPREGFQGPNVPRGHAPRVIGPAVGPPVLNLGGGRGRPPGRGPQVPAPVRGRGNPRDDVHGGFPNDDGMGFGGGRPNMQDGARGGRGVIDPRGRGRPERNKPPPGYQGGYQGPRNIPYPNEGGPPAAAGRAGVANRARDAPTWRVAEDDRQDRRAREGGRNGPFDDRGGDWDDDSQHDDGSRDDNVAHENCRRDEQSTTHIRVERGSPPEVKRWADEKPPSPEPPLTPHAANSRPTQKQDGSAGKEQPRNARENNEADHWEEQAAAAAPRRGPKPAAIVPAVQGPIFAGGARGPKVTDPILGAVVTPLAPPRVDRPVPKEKPQVAPAEQPPRRAGWTEQQAAVPPPAAAAPKVSVDVPVAQESPVKRAAVDPLKPKGEARGDKYMSSALECPITMEIMKDPVMATDGHTYERRAIEEWLTKKATSPITGLPVTDTKMVPNYSMRSIIQEREQGLGRGTS